MTTTVIAYFPSPPRGVWHIGPVPIRAYALFIIVGIIAALLIGDRRWEARGGERGVIYDIALWAVPFGLIGGRLWDRLPTGGLTLVKAVRDRVQRCVSGTAAWESGASRLRCCGCVDRLRPRGIPLPAFGDAIAPGIVLAQAIGRLGNYFNQELFGRETTMPWSWRSSIGATRPDSSMCIRLTGCRPGSWRWLSSRPFFTNCSGIYWCSRC